jgi:hypothetical protein
MKSIYLPNKYTKWYYSIIETAKNRIIEGYTEKHHIIPRCFGGTDNSDNLVELTAREHYICHLLLTKMLEGSDKYKMIYGYLIMAQGKSRYNQRDYKINSRLYESIKSQQKHSEETKRKLSEYNTGKKLTEETKLKISLGHKGQKAWNKGMKMPPRSEEHRRKLSEAVKGHNMPVTKETKKKISDSLKGRIPWNKGKKKVVNEFP